MEYKDIMDRELKPGQLVVYSNYPHAYLKVGTIHKLTPKGVMVKKSKKNISPWEKDPIFKYCNEVAIVNGILSCDGTVTCD